MKKLICILAAVMMVFAVSCSNDNPSPDATAPVINAPAVNTDTDYENLSTSEKITTIVQPLLSLVGDAQIEGADSLIDEVIAEGEAEIMAGNKNGSVSKSNSAGTITVIATYENSTPQNLNIYYLGYVYKGYTIWGSWEDAEDYTVRDNETGKVTRVRAEFPDEGGTVYYLNDVFLGELSY